MVTDDAMVMHVTLLKALGLMLGSREKIKQETKEHSYKSILFSFKSGLQVFSEKNLPKSYHFTLNTSQ